MRRVTPCELTLGIRSPCNGLIGLPTSSYHPMGNCCSKEEPPTETRELAPHPQIQPSPRVVEQPVVEVPASLPRSRQSSIRRVRESPQVERTSSHQRSRAKSAPQKPQREEAPPLPSPQRPRVKSSVASSSRSPSSDHSQTSAGKRGHG